MSTTNLKILFRLHCFKSRQRNGTSWSYSYSWWTSGHVTCFISWASSLVSWINQKTLIKNDAFQINTRHLQYLNTERMLSVNTVNEDFFTVIQTSSIPTHALTFGLCNRQQWLRDSLNHRRRHINSCWYIFYFHRGRQCFYLGFSWFCLHNIEVHSVFVATHHRRVSLNNIIYYPVFSSFQNWCLIQTGRVSLEDMSPRRSYIYKFVWTRVFKCMKHREYKTLCHQTINHNSPRTSWNKVDFH